MGRPLEPVADLGPVTRSAVRVSDIGGVFVVLAEAVPAEARPAQARHARAHLRDGPGDWACGDGFCMQV
jgi:hypothetical protein